MSKNITFSEGTQAKNFSNVAKNGVNNYSKDDEVMVIFNMERFNCMGAISGNL